LFDCQAKAGTKQAKLLPYLLVLSSYYTTKQLSNLAGFDASYWKKWQGETFSRDTSWLILLIKQQGRSFLRQLLFGRFFSEWFYQHSACLLERAQPVKSRSTPFVCMVRKKTTKCLKKSAQVVYGLF